MRGTPAVTQFMKAQADKHIRDGLTDYGTSEFVSPSFTVKKADGSMRPVIDYRKLNENTIPNSYPMITIDDILKATAGKAVFSKCDSANGYHQIPLRDLKDGKYSAYSLPSGSAVLIPSSMQMGLNGASHTFQAEMDNIIRPLQFEAVLAYQDDLLVFSEDVGSHLEHLRRLFERAKEANLKLKLGKCEFFTKRLEFLAHIVLSLLTGH
jgi:putative transposase